MLKTNFLVLGIFLVGLGGCGATGGGLGSLNSGGEVCDLEAGNCVKANKELLELTIYNSRPIPLVATAVDVGGGCNEGAFPKNYITWSLTRAGFSLLSNQTTQGQCVDGRFHIRIALPSPFDDSQPYNLSLQIYGVDAYGNVQTNELKGKIQNVTVQKPAS